MEDSVDASQHTIVISLHRRRAAIGEDVILHPNVIRPIALPPDLKLGARDNLRPLIRETEHCEGPARVGKHPANVRKLRLRRHRRLAGGVDVRRVESVRRDGVAGPRLEDLAGVRNDSLDKRAVLGHRLLQRDHIHGIVKEGSDVRVVAVPRRRVFLHNEGHNEDHPAVDVDDHRPRPALDGEEAAVAAGLHRIVKQVARISAGEAKRADPRPHQEAVEELLPAARVLRKVEEGGQAAGGSPSPSSTSAARGGA